MQHAGVAQLQAGDVDAVICLAAAQPGEPQRTASGEEWCRAAFELGLQFVDGDALGRGKRDWLNSPTDIARGNRLRLRGFPCAAHTVGETLGKYQPVLG